MANLAEVSQWENVIRQLENGEAATGGADGLANVQAKQLANRTKWLKENYLPLTGGALAGKSLTWNGDDLAGSAIVAKSLGINGYVKYASGLTIQWEQGEIASFSNNVATIYFPINFTTNPTVSVFGAAAVFSVKSIDKTSVTIYGRHYADNAVISSGTVYGTLLAIGY